VATSREVNHLLSFDGGLNTVDPPSELRDNELVECNNFFVGLQGQLTKRFGLMKLGTLLNTSNPYGFMGLDHSNGRLVMASVGIAGIRKMQYPTFVDTAITGSPGGEIPRWYLWVNNTGYLGYVGTPGIRPLPGAGTVVGANIANSPSSSVAAYHKGRLFTNVYNNPGRLFFSDPLDPTVGTFTFQVTNFLNVDITDTEEISAIVPLGDLLIIFKWNSIWTLYVQGTSPADWVLRRVSNRIGCAQAVFGHKTALVYNNEIYFIDKLRGIFKTNGSSVLELSRKVWRIPEGIFGLSGAGTIFSLAVWGNYLLVTVKDRLSPLPPSRAMFAYNMVNEAWSSWDFLDDVFDDFTVVPSSTSNPGPSYLLATILNEVYIASPEFDQEYYDEVVALGLNSFADGFAYSVPGTGAAYTSSFQTKEFTSSIDAFLRLKWVGLEYIARGSPSFKIVREGVQSAATTPGFHATLRKGYKIPGYDRAHTIALRSEHALTSPYEFYRANLHLVGKRPIVTSGAP
jgi:hypothetical protein